MALLRKVIVTFRLDPEVYEKWVELRKESGLHSSKLVELMIKKKIVKEGGIKNENI